MEQALLAADRLIVPCTTNGSSARAISNVGRLLYGHEEPSICKKASFNYKATEEFSMTLPKIHLVAMNKSTTHDKKPARAFDKMYENIKDRVREQRKSLPDSLSRTDDDVFIGMLDVYSVVIIASYHGILIQELQAGKMYHIDEDPTQVNHDSLES